MPKIIVLLLLFFSFTSCSHRLTVQTRYFSHESLASFYVRTPDPQENNPPVGQSLLIFWKLKSEFCRFSELKVTYTIRFRNRTEVQESFFITEPRGYYDYCLANDDYFNSGGILTYKVELFGDGQLIDEWRQQLWTDLIRFNN